MNPPGCLKYQFSELKLKRSLVHPLMTILLCAVSSQHGFPARAQNGAESVTTVEMLRKGFYQYDRALPLNATLEELNESDNKQAESRIRYKLGYDSAHDQRVTS